MDDNANSNSEQKKEEILLKSGAPQHPLTDEDRTKGGQATSIRKKLSSKLNGMRGKRCDRCKKRNICSFYQQGEFCKAPNYIYEMLEIYHDKDKFQNYLDKSAQELEHFNHLFQEKEAQTDKERYYAKKDMFLTSLKAAEFIFGKNENISQKTEISGKVGLAVKVGEIVKTVQKENEMDTNANIKTDSSS